MSKQEKNPDTYQSVTDRAKAEIMKWASKPATQQEIRTFSQITKHFIFPASAIQTINNRRRQLLDSKMLINNLSEQDFAKKYPDGLPIGHPVEITFTIDDTLEDVTTRELVEEMLLLSVSALPSPRANLFIDMIKNMNRPNFNPMAMLGGMMGGNTETNEDLIEEVNYGGE